MKYKHLKKCCLAEDHLKGQCSLGAHKAVTAYAVLSNVLETKEMGAGAGIPWRREHKVRLEEPETMVIGETPRKGNMQ